MKTISAILIVLALAGCEPKERDNALSEGQQALDHAKAAVGPTVNSVAEEAQKAFDSGSKEAMIAARTQLENLQAKIAEESKPNSETHRQLARLHDEIAGIDAKIRVADIKSALNESAAKLAAAKDALAKRLADSQKQFDHAKAEHDGLEKRLAEAQKAVDAAGAKIQSTVNGQ